jgi:hypothetical protein
MEKLGAFIFLVAVASSSSAQTSSIAGGLAETVIEQLGKKQAVELAKFGGNAAVRHVFERAAEEGGETVARQLANYAERYGVAALRASEVSPAKMVPALGRLGDDLVRPAIYAAAREPSVVTELMAKYGDDALRLAAKHPGVGPRIATALGRDGINVGLNIPTDEAIRLARYSDEIVASPVSSTTKKELLNSISRSPKRVLDEIEKHPKLLFTTAGCATFIAIAHENKQSIFGSSEHPGTLERIVHTPLAVVSAAVGVGILLWFGSKIWLMFRSHRRNRSVAS